MTTISGSFGKGPVRPKHDLRQGKDLPSNIDKNLSKDNVILENHLIQKTIHSKDGSVSQTSEPIDDWINRRMQPAVDAYDATQPQKCRKISEKYEGKYTKWHEENNKHDGKPIEKYYEFVAQIGEHFETKWNKETEKNDPVLGDDGQPVKSLGALYYEADDATKQKMRDEIFFPSYEKILSHFKEKYPHLEVLYATVHYDEPNGTPHMHIGICPIGEKFGNGLQERVGIGHALGNDGVERKKNRAEGFQMERMYDEMNSFIKEVIKENEHLKKYEIKETVRGRKHEASDKYRSVAGAVKEATVEAIEERKAKIDARDAAIHAKDQAIKLKDEAIEAKNQKLDELDNIINSKSEDAEKLAKLDDEIASKNKEIESLQKTENEARSELLATRKTLASTQKHVKKEEKKSKDLLQLRQGLLEYVVDDDVKDAIDNLLDYLNEVAYNDRDGSYGNSVMAAEKLQNFLEAAKELGE